MESQCTVAKYEIIYSLLNSKFMNELARPVMGTIILVMWFLEHRSIA